MCGRFSQSSQTERYRRIYGIDGQGDFNPRWNVAPGTCVLLVRLNQDGKRELVSLWWGLVPNWAKDPKALPRPINARAETVAETPFFRDAWRHGRRCLIPADGFYEWKADGKKKRPFFIRRKDCEPMAFAGLYEQWQRPGATAHPSCTVIVTDANELLRPIHDRMPVIINQDDFERWLDPATRPDELQQLLRPYPGRDMEAYPVSTAVNVAKNDGPELVEPI